MSLRTGCATTVRSGVATPSLFAHIVGKEERYERSKP